MSSSCSFLLISLAILVLLRPQFINAQRMSRRRRMLMMMMMMQQQQHQDPIYIQPVYMPMPNNHMGHNQNNQNRPRHRPDEDEFHPTPQPTTTTTTTTMSTLRKVITAPFRAAKWGFNKIKNGLGSLFGGGGSSTGRAMDYVSISERHEIGRDSGVAITSATSEDQIPAPPIGDPGGQTSTALKNGMAANATNNIGTASAALPISISKSLKAVNRNLGRKSDGMQDHAFPVTTDTINPPRMLAVSNSEGQVALADASDRALQSLEELAQTLQQQQMQTAKLLAGHANNGTSSINTEIGEGSKEL